MGGRGSGSGSGGGGSSYGGHGSLSGIVGAYQSGMRSSNGSGIGNGSNFFHQGEGNTTGDYTDNNNPALLKWQGQDDTTKVSRYLAKLGKMQTPAQDAEGYAYHPSAFQNMVIDQNLNSPVYAKMNAADFNKYVQQNNLTPIYRGWAGGTASRDRFENAAASHTGTGMYGEGYYFGDKSTASSYSSVQTTAALSPAARVVDLDVVRRAINSHTSSSSFNKNGATATSHYANNKGEAQMALKMGYNVIRTDWSYVVLTRDALVIKK